MTAATQPPDLDHAAARWQWALDAAARALDADRFFLPSEEISHEAKRLVRERQETGSLLGRVAALRRTTPAPWLATGPVTPALLGLPAPTRACLFDLDGVLTDSDALHAAAWAEALDPVLAALAEPDAPFVPFDRVADYHAYFDGRPRLEGIRLFLSGRGVHLPQERLDAIARRKGELVEHGLRARGVAALAGAQRYLQAAALARLGRAAVSASTRTLPMLEHAGLTHLVEVCVDADVMRTRRLRSRPAPDILLAACDELRIAPQRAVSLTHSGAGVVAAVAAGIPVVGIATGEEAEALAAYGAQVVVPSLDSLLDQRLR